MLGGWERSSLIASLDEGVGRRSRRYLSRVGLILITITVIAASLAVWQLYRDRIADEEKDAKDLAVVLGAQTARSFQAVDLVVRETRKMVLAAGVADSDHFRQQMGTVEVHRYLLDRLRSLPQANAIVLLDDMGEIVNSSRTWPARASDATDRDFYAYWRVHDRHSAFIVTIRRRPRGSWIAPIILLSPPGFSWRGGPGRRCAGWRCGRGRI